MHARLMDQMDQMDQTDQTGSFAEFDAKQKKPNPGLVMSKATSCLHNLSSATAVGISSLINSLYAEPSRVTAHRRVFRLTLISVFTTAVICSRNKLQQTTTKYNIWFRLKRAQRLFDAIVRSSFVKTRVERLTHCPVVPADGVM